MQLKKHLHATISGRVQGVGFRYYVQRQASMLLLTGWVRNLRNGNVEVCVEGYHKELSQFIIKLRQGPPSSFVVGVDYSIENELEDYSTFKILSTL